MMADENPNNENDEGGFPQPAQQNAVTPAAEAAAGSNNGNGLVNSNEQLAYVGGFFSAMVLLVSLTSAESLKDHKYHSYGISVAVITMFFSLVGWFLSQQGQANSALLSYNSMFLFLWNFIGACFMTFGGPFKVTGNGYFASWGIAVFAVMGLGVVNVDAARDVSKTPLGSLLGLVACAIVVIIAILSEGFNHYKGELVFSFILACLTCVVGFVFTKVVTSSGSLMEFPVLGILAVMWIVSSCLLTFRGPFLSTGNGYFSAWGGAVTSVFTAMAAKERGGGAFQEGQ